MKTREICIIICITFLHSLIEFFKLENILVSWSLYFLKLANSSLFQHTVRCENRIAPLSGSVTMTTDGLVTIATYNCVSGYSLNSTGITTCQTDGTWDLPNADCCK